MSERHRCGVCGYSYMIRSGFERVGRRRRGPRPASGSMSCSLPALQSKGPPTHTTPGAWRIKVKTGDSLSGVCVLWCEYNNSLTSR